MRLFVVNFHFVYCGEVFADGLRHAADDLGITHAAAYWDDADLAGKIARFAPDLILVVHGRKFAARWGGRFECYPTAVWLVDEPYETDDTARWSPAFDTVFVNDPATLHRHRNAHYLPMCYDPHVHRKVAAARIYPTGFVGDRSALRLRYLSALAEAGLLGYVAGDRWRASELRRHCIAGNVPAWRTATLYQQTEIVINVFRETHHYNSRGIEATAMNPRIYEALGCGAVVVSERRSGIAATFPLLPQFSSPRELVDIVGGLLAQPETLSTLRCATDLSGQAYRDRLSAVLQACSLPLRTTRKLDIMVSQ